MKNKRGKSVMVFSPKGGVGKTVISASLAGAAFLRGKKVLLLDLDIFNGGLSVFINKDINKTIFHLLDDLNNSRYNNFSDYIYKYNDNIDVLVAPKDPRQGSKLNGKYIDRIIDRFLNDYDLVIVDGLSILNDFNILTMDCVNNILFIITNDMICLKNTKNILNIFKDNNITNYKILYNNSFELKNNYFTFHDIGKIIDNNIDYMLDKNSLFSNITSYMYEGKIPYTFSSSMKNKELLTVLNKFLDDVFNKGDENNEEK